jgi:surfeit locus 1 family protein
MYFRPLPKFTAFCLPLFLALVALGVWQLQRLQWKLGLIAEIAANLHAPPISFDGALGLGEKAEYRRVALSGHYDNAREAYVFTTGQDGSAVYHVLTPFVLDDGREVVVDRGFVPPELRSPQTRTLGLLDGERHIVGVWRTPDRPGLFTPLPDLQHHVWYARDVAGIQKTFALRLSSQAIVEADATPVPGGWPKGGQTVIALRNDHLQYALTWFLLAAALVVVYFAYHRSRGRFMSRS